MNEYLIIGEINRLVIARRTDNGAYLNSLDDDEVLLPNQYITESMRDGDQIDVFVYTDSEDRIVASTVFPKAMAEEFGYFEVVDVAPFGAFVDWGLPKDLFVPKALQKTPFYVGMKFVLRVCIDDETGRIIGAHKYNDYLVKDFKDLVTNQKVKLLVREKTLLGYKVIVDNLYDGLIFHSDIFEDIDIGDEKVGYVKLIRGDGKLDISLKPIGDKDETFASEKIIEVLKQCDGSINFTYKSSPEDIQKEFGLSRKAYKRALTKLIEQNIITLGEESITLK